MLKGVFGDQVTDSTLLQQIQAVMGALYDRYATTVYAVALRILKDSMDAEDLVQEIFLRVWESSERIIPLGTVTGG